MEKKLRLRSSVDFRKVRQQGRSWVHPLMVLYIFPNSFEHNRFGFAVNRRIGCAVVRNRIKRRMREAARYFKDEIGQGRDLVFIARSPIFDAKFQAIKQAVETLLRRACLLKITGLGVRPCAQAINLEAED